MDIGEVKFNNGHLCASNRIVQGNGRMRVGPSVQNDTVKRAARCVHSIDQRTLVVGLAARDVNADRLPMGNTHRLDIGECRVAINLGLARPKKIQVWPVQNKDRGHRRYL